MAYSGLISQPNSRFRDHHSYVHISETLGLMRGPKCAPKMSKNDFFYNKVNRRKSRALS